MIKINKKNLLSIAFGQFATLGFIPLIIYFFLCNVVHGMYVLYFMICGIAGWAIYNTFVNNNLYKVLLNRISVDNFCKFFLFQLLNYLFSLLIISFFSYTLSANSLTSSISFISVAYSISTIPLEVLISVYIIQLYILISFYKIRDVNKTIPAYIVNKKSKIINLGIHNFLKIIYALAYVLFAVLLFIGVFSLSIDLINSLLGFPSAYGNVWMIVFASVFFWMFGKIASKINHYYLVNNSSINKVLFTLILLATAFFSFSFYFCYKLTSLGINRSFLYPIENESGIVFKSPLTLISYLRVLFLGCILTSSYMTAKRFVKYNLHTHKKKFTLPVFYYAIFIFFIPVIRLLDIDFKILDITLNFENKINFKIYLIGLFTIYILIIMNKIKNLDSIISLKTSRAMPSSMVRFVKSWFNLILLLTIFTNTFGLQIISLSTFVFISLFMVAIVTLLFEDSRRRFKTEA